jgi:hypothetical protein
MRMGGGYYGQKECDDESEKFHCTCPHGFSRSLPIGRARATKARGQRKVK